MNVNYRGWRISVEFVRSKAGWSASSTVRPPGAHRSTEPRTVVPAVTGATTQDSALEEVVRRTREWIDLHAFGEEH